MKLLRMVASLSATGALAAAFLVGWSSPALAHEERTIGAYQVSVGWGAEPAYTGVLNSVQLVLSNSAGQPVTDLGDSLKVEVSFNAQTSEPMALEPGWDADSGVKGDYRAWFVPTQPGTYTFHFTGTVKGQNVDEKFTSSETTFDDVKSVTSVEFPTKDPTTGQLLITATRNRAIATQARQQASTAQAVGIVGIAVGALGLIVAVVAIALAALKPRREVAPEPGPQATV